MKTLMSWGVFFCWCVGGGFNFSWANSLPHRDSPPHLDLHLSTADYIRLFREHNKKMITTDIFGIESTPLNSLSERRSSGGLQDVVYAGHRNFEWLEFINQHREEPLSLSSPETQKSYPIESPLYYNPEIILARFQRFKEEVPQALGDVFFGEEDFPQSPTTDIETYLKWARKIDGLYQTSLRWRMMSAYLPSLRQRRWRDIRGYYFLQKEVGLEEILMQWHSLPLEKRSTLKKHLLHMCLNRKRNRPLCNQVFEEHVIANTLWDFYIEHLLHNKSLYDSYFKISNPRRDFSWKQGHSIASFPFSSTSPEIQDWLREHIEDEFQIFYKDKANSIIKNWSLKLVFKTFAQASVRFVPDVVPHVSGGNTIYMNANTPRTDYNAQWTIRHEFGHVLRFPDCYVEFYDDKEEAIINYQIDTTNIMCSRTGSFKEEHFRELQRHYEVPASR